MAIETSAGEPIPPMSTHVYHRTGTLVEFVPPGFPTFRSRGQRNKESLVAH